MNIFAALIVSFFIFNSSLLLADEKLEVVPKAEKEYYYSFQEDKAPKKTQGIKEVKSIGQILLGEALPELKGKQVRARKIVIEPNGKIAIHRHDDRPGMAYIVSGEIYEFRNDAKNFIIRKSGDIAFEWTGVTHWWENRSDKDVIALVIDMVPE